MFESFRTDVLSLVEKSNGTFSSISDDFLDLLYTRLNSHRKKGQVNEGQYRQKGNVLRDLIVAIVKKKSGDSIHGQSIRGFTERHNLDLSLKIGDSLPIAGEVKLSGTPPHIIPESGEMKPERPGWVDLDKRLKEVCYTAVDLKLKFGGTNVGQWHKWIANAPPKFYSIWGFYMGNQPPKKKLDLLIPKFLNLKQYHNGVSVFFYGERGNRYEQIIDERIRGCSIDDVISAIVTELKRLGSKP